jgi:hypothetical protein
MGQTEREPRVRPERRGNDPALTAEADRFVAERIRAHLSTEAVDEEAAEDLLRRAYRAAKIAAPNHVHWLDGPLELAALLGRETDWVEVAEEYRDRVAHCAWDDATLDIEEIRLLKDGQARARESVDRSISRLRQHANAAISARIKSIGGPQAGAGIEDGPWSRIASPVWTAVREPLGERIWRAVSYAARCPIGRYIRDVGWGIPEYATWHGVRAYDEAPMLAEMRFFDEYFEHNVAGALACFNELTSGYWLGNSVAFVVRKPRVLGLDAEGRLHNESSPAVEYPDGWGFYAWHGVEVPEHFVRAPETLTRDDFLIQPDLELRRIVQERMDQRFVQEIGARYVDGGDQGVLYEIELPDDPEEVARYVQVQDASTDREYYLRVPPTIQTVEEAVAWTFGLTAGEYRPARET